MYSGKNIIYYGFETAYSISHLLGDIDGIFYKVSYYKVKNIPLWIYFTIY